MLERVCERERKRGGESKGERDRQRCRERRRQRERKRGRDRVRGSERKREKLNCNEQSGSTFNDNIGSYLESNKIIQ